jgi:acetyl esterase
VRYVAEHRSQFGANDAPLIVIGDSAGGNLAACVAAMTREEHLLAAQVLIYPPMGPEVLSKSAHEYATGYMLEMDHLHFDYRQYLASYRNHADPRVSPLLNEDLSGSVPAIVVVAEFDPLRDEGLAYAGLLEHFGTPVEILEGEGMVHGFLQLGGVVPECLSILDDLALHLERFVSA